MKALFQARSPGTVALSGIGLLMISAVALDSLAQGLGAGMFEPKYNETARNNVYSEQNEFRPEKPPETQSFRKKKSAADPLFDGRFKPYDYDDPVKWRTRERDHEQGNVNPGAVDPVPLFRL